VWSVTVMSIQDPLKSANVSMSSHFNRDESYSRSPSKLIFINDEDKLDAIARSLLPLPHSSCSDMDVVSESNPEISCILQSSNINPDHSDAPCGGNNDKGHQANAPD